MDIFLKLRWFTIRKDLLTRFYLCLIGYLLTLNNVESAGLSQDPILIQKAEPALSIQDQYIIIGCVCGFTLGLLVAFIIVCLLRCNGKKKGDKEDFNDSYKPIEKFTSSDYTHSIGSGDRKLATSAQMYHYQLHKQQLIDMENKADAEMLTKENKHDPDSDSVEECTVFECPGLAKMPNMEIHNPLFDYNKRDDDKDVVMEGGR